MDIWSAASWVGKLAFCGFFFMNGLNHFTAMQGVVGYAHAKNLPAAGVLVPLTGVMLMGAPLMILLKWHPLWGFGLLAIFLVPAAFLIHNYWVETEPMQRGNQRAHFGKNLALAAACLLLAVLVHQSGAI